MFVIYLDNDRKREGIGRQLLNAITDDKNEHGAKEQWVLVTKDYFMKERTSYELPEEEGFILLRY